MLLRGLALSANGLPEIEFPKQKGKWEVVLFVVDRERIRVRVRVRFVFELSRVRSVVVLYSVRLFFLLEGVRSVDDSKRQ